MDSLCDLTTLRALKHCGSLGHWAEGPDRWSIFQCQIDIDPFHLDSHGLLEPTHEKMIPRVYMAEALDDPICCVGGVTLQDGGGSRIDRRRLAGLFFTLTTNPASLCHCLPPTRGKSVWKLTLSNWLASVSLSCKYLWPSLMLLFFFLQQVLV